MTHEPFLTVSTTTVEELDQAPNDRFAVIQKNESLCEGDEVPIFVMVPFSGPDALKLAEFICKHLNDTMTMSDGSWRHKGNDCVTIPFRRAGGDVLCSCGKKYYDHPMDELVLSAIDKRPFLNVLCNGDRVKL